MKAFCEKWDFRPLFAVCRTQYASVCMWRGAWAEAERELTSATDELAASRPAMTGEGFVRLGELRRRQGKLDEAMGVVEPVRIPHPLASLGRASVTFDSGDLEGLRRSAERHLRRLPPSNPTERAAALELMVRACLEQGRTDEAAVLLLPSSRPSRPRPARRRCARWRLSRPAWYRRGRATGKPPVNSWRCRRSVSGERLAVRDRPHARRAGGRDEGAGSLRSRCR